MAAQLKTQFKLLISLCELGDFLVTLMELGLHGLLERSVVILEFLVDGLKMFLSFFFSDDRFPLTGLEGLDHSVIVALNFLSLILLLLHLNLHELNLLLSDRLVLLVFTF